MNPMHQSYVTILEKCFNKKPIYIYVNPHEEGCTAWTCTVKIGGIIANGIDSTKKKAKQKAAQEALVLLANDKAKFLDYCSRLNELAQSNRLASPIFTDKREKDGTFTSECRYAGKKSIGKGPDRKIARNEAAKLACEMINPKPSPTIKQVLDKYNEIIKAREKEKPKIEESKIETTHPELNFRKFQVDVNETDFFEKLKSVGHNYDPIVLQTDPYILALHLGERATVLGVGKTKEEAEEDLIAEADLIFFSTDM
ncbi:unnamed protein product [Diabrotica balteata]|uniref:DRBM domain-containing protein n=1 Tax=Diabrotica balteata TaxID=107213 RepID=A0A9N9XB57_DIABA|nr:unnamed protein product [Diabrotica balteata]